MTRFKIVEGFMEGDDRGNFYRMEHFARLMNLCFPPRVSDEAVTAEALMNWQNEKPDGDIKSYLVYDHESAKYVAYAFTTREKNSVEALLVQIGIDPEFQRKGLGSHLIDRIKTDLCHDKVVMLRLVTRMSNSVARLFYSDQGFVVTERIRGFYKDVGKVEDGQVWAIRLRGI